MDGYKRGNDLCRCAPLIPHGNHLVFLRPAGRFPAIAGPDAAGIRICAGPVRGRKTGAVRKFQCIWFKLFSKVLFAIMNIMERFMVECL